MIRILHFVSNISKTSGVMNVIMNYYRNIDSKEVQFDFLYMDKRNDTFYEEIVSRGGSVYKIQRPSKLFSFYNSLYELSLLVTEEYDIIHVHDFFMGVFLKSFQKKAKIKKMIIHSHVTKYSDGNRISSLRNWLLSRNNSKYADYFMACSYKAGKTIFGKSFDKRGSVLNNAISVDRFLINGTFRDEIRKKYNLTNSLVVGHVGNMYPPKNHVFIIEVFNELIKIEENAKLLLVGDGKLRAIIEEKCKALEITERVVFVGKRDDVEKYLQAMDVFIFPSIFEGLGNALIEAQASGLPCVFSDVIPKEANVLKDQNIILSLSDSARIWANHVSKLKDRLPQEEVIEKINDAGFNIEREANKLIGHYEKILNEKSASR